MCTFLFTWWHHCVSVPSFEHIYLLLLYLSNNYILYSIKSIHILYPLNEVYQSSLVSMQSEQLWKMECWHIFLWWIHLYICGQLVLCVCAKLIERLNRINRTLKQNLHNTIIDDHITPVFVKQMVRLRLCGTANRLESTTDSHWIELLKMYDGVTTGLGTALTSCGLALVLVKRSFPSKY